MTAPKVADVPLAKLTPAPWNPRTIREERFKNLCASVEADPEFLWRRPILAMADGTIYAGNMRYRAAVHLKLKSVPAIVEDVPEKLAKERALRDNAQWGDWHDDQLAEMVYQMAADGSDVKLLGIEEDELARLLGLTGTGEGEEPKGSLAEQFLVPPFTVLNAREGWWQDRKRMWLALGIESELGRGNGGGGTMNEAIVNQGAMKAIQRQAAAPGGSARPAWDYSKRQRGDGRGRPINA